MNLKPSGVALRSVVLALVLAFALVGAQTRGSSPSLKVHMINVSGAKADGEAILVQLPNGTNLLIDTGLYQSKGARVLDYLAEVGVSNLNVLLASHAHADHIGGHAALLGIVSPEGLIIDSGIPNDTQTYKNYINGVCSRGLASQFKVVKAGDTVQLDDSVSIEVLNPQVAGPLIDPCHPVFFEDNDQIVNGSIVLKLTYQNTSFLFTGDIYEAGEHVLERIYGGRLQSTVLKVSHHGSESSSSPSFLGAVDPIYGLISSAPQSSNDNPDCRTLKALWGYDVTTYWTGLHGTVVAASDGASVVFSVEHTGTTNPFDFKACGS